jgi:hypothetical protein
MRMAGTPTPRPTPIAILSLVARPEDPLLPALPEEPPLSPPLPDVGEELAPFVVGVESFVEVVPLPVDCGPPA